MSPQSAPVSTWEEKAAQKRAMARAAIPKEWLLSTDILASLQFPLENNPNKLMLQDIPRRSGILTEKDLQITEAFGVDALLQKLASGDLSSVEVTRAFSKRAAIAQQLTNCLTEVFFDQAEKRAKELDALRESGTLAGPLHGLPISLKDGFQVKGTQATIGLVAYLDHEISTRNSNLVDLLLAQGAVLFVKTNIPQSLMTADSHNNVFGRTLNPWNTLLGAGGSSGGEGAMIAFRAAPLGIGTDVGGSIRIPALCCGTYGFRPTANRVPYGSQSTCADRGKKFVESCAGPLANDMEGLDILMRAVMAGRPAEYDYAVLDTPWRAVTYKPTERLRLGVLEEHPAFPLHPTVQRNFAQVIDKLKEAGHDIIHITPSESRLDEIEEVAWELFDCDDTARKIIASAGEPLVPSVTAIRNDIRGRGWTFLSEIQDLEPIDRLAVLIRKRVELTDCWHRLMHRERFDAVVAPSAQNTAVEHDHFGCAPYTTFLNILDYPACVIPTGKATTMPEDEYLLKPGQVGPQYNPQVVDGMPCSVQVFTYRMRDEECLAVSKIINQCI